MCPKCGAAAIVTQLEQSGDKTFVDAYECEACHHVWTDETEEIWRAPEK